MLQVIFSWNNRALFWRPCILCIIANLILLDTRLKMSSDSSTVLVDCLWLSFFSQGLKMLLSDAGSYATGEPDQPSPGEHRLKQTVVYLHIQQLHHSTSIHLESQSSIPRVSAQSPPTPENDMSLFSCLMLHSVHQLALTVSVCCLLLSRSCSF